MNIQVGMTDDDSWPILDFSKFPNEMISGLSLTQINDVMQTSSRLNDPLNLTEDQMNELAQLHDESMENCFTEEQEEELRQIEREAMPEGTQIQTKHHIEKFRSFLVSKGFSERFENVPNERLNDFLRLYYANLKTKDDQYYSPSSLICFRASIQRYLSSPDVNRNVNIINGNDFQRANGVLRAMVGKYLKSKQPKHKGYGAITENDMSKICQYFDRSTLQRLQDEVLFNVIYFFGLRGREHLRHLTTDSIKIHEDDSGAKYCELDILLMSKNVKASLNSRENSDHKQARMYETACKDTCPVEAYRKYMEYFSNDSKYPSLFPKILKNDSLSTQVVLGKTSLDNLMKRLSNTLKLSKVYTNHCIRVSVVTIMREQGASTSEIMLVTGHKSASSVNRYERKRRDRDMRSISEKLTNAAYSSNEKTEIQQQLSGGGESSRNTIIGNLNLRISEAYCTSKNTYTEQQTEVRKKAKLTVHQEQVENVQNESKKKAKLFTSWGLLEIDL